MSALVETIGLTRYFEIGRDQRVHAVEDVSLAVAPREIVGLVGESGSGKSTLGKTLLGLYRKNRRHGALSRGNLAGSIQTPADFPGAVQKNADVFQDPYSSLKPAHDVGEIIGEGLRLHTDLSKKEINGARSSWLDQVGLSGDHASRYPHEFSGGQRQRIGIARAMILEPEFVVCDEPVSALDVSVQAQVINLLGELKESLGLTLLFIAHDLSMVRHVSDRMAVMYLGSLVEVGVIGRCLFSNRNTLHRVAGRFRTRNPTLKSSATALKPTIQGEIPSRSDIPPGCRFAGPLSQGHWMFAARLPPS